MYFFSFEDHIAHRHWGYCSHLIFGEKQRKSQLYVNFFIILINHPEYVLFLRLNGEWVAKHVTGEKKENNTYVADFKYDCFTGQSMFGWKSWSQLPSVIPHTWILLQWTIRGVGRLQSLRSPSTLFCHEQRVHTHIRGLLLIMSASLENNMCRCVCHLVLTGNLQQPYKLTSQWSIWVCTLSFNFYKQS